MKTLRLFNNLKYDLKHSKWLLAMSLPGLIMVIVFRYLPMGGIIMAFQNYSLFLGFSGSKWVGFDNFIRFFTDAFFIRIVSNTFLLGVFDMLWGFPAPILLALMLNEVQKQWFKKITQTITYLPYFISVVIIVGIMRSVFGADEGVINGAIRAMGGNPIAFFNEPGWFRPLYIGSGIWSSVGYSSILYLAAITGIDPQLYEAAKIDGAHKINCIWHITLPCLFPTIAVLFTLRIGSILGVGFEKVLLMYNPGIYSVADVISTYTYRMGMLNQDFGYAGAVGLFNSILAILFLMFGNWLSKNLFKESMW